VPPRGSEISPGIFWPKNSFCPAFIVLISSGRTVVPGPHGTKSAGPGSSGMSTVM
jgi:hypothetical protein